MLKKFRHNCLSLKHMVWKHMARHVNKQVWHWLQPRKAAIKEKYKNSFGLYVKISFRKKDRRKSNWNCKVLSVNTQTQKLILLHAKAKSKKRKETVLSVSKQSYFNGQFFKRNSSEYTNVGFKICLYLPLHLNVICQRFHIITPFTFWDMRMWKMQNACLQTCRNNRIW